MDKRNFLQTLLAAPLLTKYIQASQSNNRQYEFYLISDSPDRWLELILEETGIKSSTGRFAFLNSHPNAGKIDERLKDSGWKSAIRPEQAKLCISSSRLLVPALPSFTMSENGRVRDIRNDRLYSIWTAFQKQSPSIQLTTFSFLPSKAGQGKSAAVYQRGQKIALLPLDRKTKKSFPVESGRITVKIEDGKAWVEDSSCRQKICRHAAPVFLAGERIICAPNRFLLEIEGAGGVDTVLG